MAGKPKFDPEITRIKLNPEQAVLVCECYVYGGYGGDSKNSNTRICGFRANKKNRKAWGRRGQKKAGNTYS